MELYKVYLVYGKEVVLHLYWANSEEDVLRQMFWTKEDEPKPIIRKIEVKEGGVMCHHIADYNFYKRLRVNNELRLI